MREDLDRIERDFAAALAAAEEDPDRVEAVRIRFLGRKGELTRLLKGLGSLPPDERRSAGKAVNELKRAIEARIDRARTSSAEVERRREVQRDRVDPTLPAREPWQGSMHPVTKTRRDLERVFREMGYTVESGPEVEDDFHNFQALNLPEGHPARDATDTFYLNGGLLLRTHTSPVQIRTMKTTPPPIRMICPGRVYRRDLDASHLPMFHQVEALVVDEGITMADLKGTLSAVWTRFYGEDVRIRLRPGYFPFVEPGAECDISCRLCRGDGCPACKRTGWMELGGAGMVHPAVFEAVGIDPERFTGFAFGLGIDRIAMMRYGVQDLRSFIENDVRFLSQFPA